MRKGEDEKSVRKNSIKKDRGWEKDKKKEKIDRKKKNTAPGNKEHFLSILFLFEETISHSSFSPPKPLGV